MDDIDYPDAEADDEPTEAELEAAEEFDNEDF